MSISIIIKNGCVVDGTGRPSFRGDIGITGDRITHIGKAPESPEALIIDARGQVVAPGFIELHTHYDPQICWDRKATPAAEHGVTTVIMGNCSLSLAPVRKGDGERLTRLFHKIEDIPPAFFDQEVPYSWESFADYLDFVRKGIGPNVAPVVGHSALRHYVMGNASQERVATDAELAAMCEELERALRAGAFGLSMAFAHLTDENDRPVPSSYADLRERIELAKVVARSGRSYVQCTIHPTSAEIRARELEELATISLEAGVSCSALTIMDSPTHPDSWRAELALLEQLQRRGARLYAQSQTRPMDMNFSLAKAFIVFYLIPSWAEVMLGTPAERATAFANPTVRKRLIDDMEASPHINVLRCVQVRDVFCATNKPYAGRALTEIGTELGRSIVDVMLDIALADDLKTVFDVKNAIHANDVVLGELLAHPLIQIGSSDAGAHVAQFSGEGDTTYLLEHFVREQGLMSLETAVKRVTGDIARDFNIRDRGTLAVGHFADLVIFDPDAIARGDEVLVNDMPGGVGRYLRHASGVDKVIINGELFVDNGSYCAVLPGRIV